MRGGSWVRGGWVGVVVVLWAGVARALVAPLEPGFYLGPVESHLAVEAGSLYESNVFHTSVSPEADLAWTVAPQLRLDYRRGTWFESEGALGGRWWRYAGLITPGTREQSRHEWNGQLAMRLRFPAGLDLGLEGRVKDTEDPLYGDLTLSRELLRRRRYEVGVRVGQRLAAGLVEQSLRYNFSTDDYDGAGDYLDRRTHRVQLEARMRPFPTAVLFARGGYRSFARPKIGLSGLSLADQVGTTRFELGASGKWGPSLEASLALGVQYRNYAAVAGRWRPVANLQGQWRPSGWTTWGTQLQYQVLDGVVSDDLVVRRAELWWRRRLGRAWEGRVKGTVWRTSYRGGYTRDDDAQTLQLGLHYGPVAPSWLEGELGYRLERRSSTVARYGYVAHVALLRLVVQY